MLPILSRGAAYTSLGTYLIFAAPVATSCASATGGIASTSSETTGATGEGAEELARGFYEPINTGDVDRYDAILAPDW